jgi:hypothetical protein
VTRPLPLAYDAAFMAGLASLGRAGYTFDTRAYHMRLGNLPKWPGRKPDIIVDQSVY